MKNALLSILCFISVSLFSQTKNHKLDVFGVVQADAALDLGIIFDKSSDRNSSFNKKDNPRNFTYGFQAQAGYNPVSWLGATGGVRYSYISDKYHSLYATGQVYFFTSPKNDDEKKFISLSFGKQFNNTQGFKNGGFVGLGLGGIPLVEEHIAHKVQLNLEGQFIGDSTKWFIGLSYGIVFHSKKYE